MTKTKEKIKNTIFISSGKGGVGKSTIAANLAVSLAKQGFNTGLLDTDFFGPSMPILFGLDNAYHKIYEEGKKELFIPISKNGVKIMSPGFLIKTKEGETQRIPVVKEAVRQIIQKTAWGNLDYLIIDMPACTGDLAVSIIKKFPKAQAILVTTPQQLSISGSRIAGNMYLKPKINIKILGIIENMSYFIPDNHPKEKHYIFGEGGGMELAREFQIPLLVKIPFSTELGHLNNQGQSVFLSINSTIKLKFRKLAEDINILMIDH
ncbi:MAG: P-loop NTPase [Bacteroidetes bacterium]|nr:P-loop NTPase [Bacteroidota bacterium]MBT4408487.1 P-loop NTPase [Bacteroidota bacterium]MBT7464098.1 P-loop NTPase [Bacteroidota bacterium]